jgi:hypothetical protein
MVMLAVPIMEEIYRYLEYGWEWKTICKIINFKHGNCFEIDELQKLYNNNFGIYRELKKLASGEDSY